MDTTNQQIKDRFDSLPEIVKGAITESNWQEKIQLIGKKNNLRIDQISSLEFETLMTMLGFINPNEYKQNIQNELGIGGGLAETITREINDNVFGKIRELLVKIDEEEKRIEEEEAKLPSKISPNETLIGAHLGIDRNKMVDEMKEHIEIIDDEDDNRDENKQDIVFEKLGGISTASKESHSIDVEKPLPEKNNAPGKIQNTLDSDPYREPLE